MFGWFSPGQLTPSIENPAIETPGVAGSHDFLQLGLQPLILEVRPEFGHGILGSVKTFGRHFTNVAMEHDPCAGIFTIIYLQNWVIFKG